MKSKSRLFSGIIATIVATSFLIPAQAANAVTITAASPVRTVSVADAWSPITPRVARAKLTWTRPVSTYGATVVGYKVEKSSNGKTWQSAISNTGSTRTTAIISSGLRIGSPNYFRVRAITSKSSTLKTGYASAVVSKSLTAEPSAPVLLGLSKITAPADGAKIIRWLPQNAAQRGGLTVTYMVLAETPSADATSCSITSTSAKTFCTLTGLVAGAQYKIKMSAKNTRGLQSSIDEYIPQDADFAKQWFLNSERGISVTRAWLATRGTSSTVVAVLDSGITNHPEFDGQLVAGYDFVSDAAKSGDGDGRDADPTDPGDGLGPDVSSWHGTHVAGIIAAKSDSTGVTGIAPGVKIQPIRVLGTLGEGSSDDLAVAIMWAAGFDAAAIEAKLNEIPSRSGPISLPGVTQNVTPAKVINLSMAGIGSCPSRVQLAVNQAMLRNVTLVAAAGNGDSSNNNRPLDNSLVYPTNCYGPISVGATGFSGDAAFYSNYGVDLSAPGGDQINAAGAPAFGMIYSTSNLGALTLGEPTYKVEQGTSMAAPVVSGIVALMYSLRPSATPENIWNSLKASVQPFPVGSSCSLAPGRCGLGTINAATALEELVGILG